MKTKGYFIGDIVEFVDGGFGIINEYSGECNIRYACVPVEGLPDHPITKRAWFSDVEIKNLIGESPLRSLKPESILNQVNLSAVKTKTQSQIQ